MYSFDIVIENLQRRNRQSKALHLMSGILLMSIGIAALLSLPQNAILIWFGLLPGVVIITALAARLIRLDAPSHIKFFRGLEASAILAIAIFMFRNKYYITGVVLAITAIMLGFSLILELQLLIGVRVVVDDKGVTRLVGGRTRYTPWSDIENVILKDNILTVDLKSNHIMQSRITNNFNEDEQQQVNDYCKVQLLVH